MTKTTKKEPIGYWLANVQLAGVEDVFNLLKREHECYCKQANIHSIGRYGARQTEHKMINVFVENKVNTFMK